MSDDDEAEIQLEEAKQFLAGLPGDPSDFTDTELTRLEAFLLSDNHGVVSVTGEFVREATARDADAMAPLVQPLIDAVVHTDALRRPPLVAAIENLGRTRTRGGDPVFDRTPVGQADPIDQYHTLLGDTECAELKRSKCAAALAAFYDSFPQDVRETVPTLLESLEPAEDDVGSLCEAAGKALGTIAGKDDQVRPQIVERFEHELDRGSLPNEGVVYGVRNLLSHRSDLGWGLVESLVDSTIQSGVERGIHEASRWHVVSSLETIAEDRPALLEPHVQQLALLLTDDKRLIQKCVIGLFGTLGESDPDSLELVVEDLIAACDDPDAEIRKRAVASLSPLNTQQTKAEEIAVDAHLSDIGSDEWRDTLTALDELKRLSEGHTTRIIDDLELVIENLDHEKWSVRSSAASVLGQIGTERPDAVRPLVDRSSPGSSPPAGSLSLFGAMEDDHKQVRADTAQALGRIGAADRELCDTFLGPLADAFEDENASVEKAAIQAIGRIGEAHPEVLTDEHVSAIVARLDHTDELVRATAAAAIGAIAEGGLEQDINVIPLVNLLDDYYLQPRIEACGALAALGVNEVVERIAPLQTHYDEGVQEAASEALEALDYDSSENDTEPASAEGDASASVVSDIPTEEAADDNTSATSSRTEATAASVDDTLALIPDVTTVQSPPQELLRYEQLELGEQLGQGTSGVVYRAQYHNGGENEPVALKVPNFEGTITQAVIEEFEQEAETWAALASRDHVVGVVDSGTQPRPWIAMELMDGGTLRERLDEFSIEQAIWTAERIAQAVRHDRTGVLHLDLKPANVLFRSTEPGTWDVPKVADWGVARALSDNQPTVEGMSPTYAAPEQFDADEFGAPSSQTDIYQLGVLTYELLTGRPPFEGNSVALMNAILTTEPEPPAKVNETVPEAVSDAVLRALRKEPAERFSTVERFQSALQSQI